MGRYTRLIGPLLIGAACATAHGQAGTNISAAHSMAWQENCGWTNWRDAGDPAGAQGVIVRQSFLSGFIWMENAGWLTVGDGSPSRGVLGYSNQSGDDAGVNIGEYGGLSGYAWGENIGWVNFDTGVLEGDRARFDRTTGRFRGWAWGENIGWLNLDDAAAYVGVACYADCDENEVLNVNDFTCFINRFATSDPYANCDGSTAEPALNVNDYICFMNRFAAGCP